ncbi:MAG: glucose-1-phosphate adenylyltransferase, partial [Ruminococcus sp.]|nr:glucose-1-phosphate adenylyltransferase [Ruminococcus sp.]
ANAIYQNINYIDRYNPEYVVILSGDHIYKMDYSKMIAAHKKNNAACTIAVIDVSIEEASRFGILNTYENGEIYEFDEKPAVPKSTNASMGIYVFTWSKLKQYLINDENNPDSDHDFGKNVLPHMLSCGERMFAYNFEGYWKDVGTIDSLWDANMDILNPNVPLDLRGIYSRNHMLPPHHLGENAQIQNSLVTDGCEVDGSLEFSILFPGVKIGKGAEINSSIIMPGAVIEEGAKILYSIISENAHIGKNAVVGGKPEDYPNRDEWGIAVIGDAVKIADGTTVAPKAMIATDVEV